MDLIDLFFLTPEQRQANELHRIADSLEASRRDVDSAGRAASRDAGVARHRAEALADEVERLRGQVASLSLVTLSLVRLLCERGGITAEALRATLRETDALDGAVDGRVSPEALRAFVGVVEPVPEGERADHPDLCRKCHRRLTKSKGRCFYCGTASG